MIEIFEKLGIEVPIFGFSHCRDVVAAVTNAGGMGVYGASMHSDAQIAIDLAWIEDKVGGKPYAVDLMMPKTYVGSDQGGMSAAEARSRIAPEYETFLAGLMEKYDVPEVPGWDVEVAENVGNQRHTAEQQQGILDTAFRFSPRLLVGALGTPPAQVIETAHRRGMLVGALAGKVSHALAHRDAGVDLIIAQSYEAGGHTGDIGGMVLTPQIVDAVAPVPVLAAGGIGTGRQMAAALALGAKGVWCGTVWLTTIESECSPLMRQKLLKATTEDTVKTRTYTGKPARYLHTAWIDEWEGPGAPPVLPTPLQSVASGRYVERIDLASGLAGATLDSGVGQLVNKPAGQVIGLLNHETTCRDVIRTMLEECASAMDGMSSFFE